MAHLTPAAHHHFATHHGIASIGQLIDCGMTRHEIKRLTELGSLEFVVQGAYRSPSVDFDELARCAAISIAHPESVIAGPTAGRLWGFRRLPADRRIHVISPPASHPTSCDWVVPYRTSTIDSDDVFERPDGIRLTTRPRTAFDLARFVSPSDLRSIIEQAMHDGRHSADDMADVAIAWQSPRRRWARTYLEQLGQRVDGGAAESHPEVMLAEAPASTPASAICGGSIRSHCLTTGKRGSTSPCPPSNGRSRSTSTRRIESPPGSIRTDGATDPRRALAGWCHEWPSAPTGTPSRRRSRNSTPFISRARSR